MSTHRLGWFVAGVALASFGFAIALAVKQKPMEPLEGGMSSHAPATMKASPKQLWHCGMHPQVVQDHPGDCPICHMALTPFGAATDDDRPTSGVSIDPRVVQNMGVRTAAATRGALTKTVRAVGVLKLPESGLHDISLKVGGWIDTLYANQEGMHINKGDVLFDLYSQELQVASQELISAIAAEKALPPDADEVVRKESRSLIESAKRKLRLWDVAEQDIDAIAKADRPPKDIPIRSPASGHLEDKTIVQGSAVQPMMKLMQVADHTKMWLEAQIYQDQIPLIKIGQEVRATIDGMPEQSWKGAITFIYPHVDHMTRTLAVRITLDNPDFALKPGMYATAEVMTQPMKDAVLVPREAVIDSGIRQIVFIDEGDGHFTPRQVRMGLSGDDGIVQIIEGVAADEKVVTSGQFLMDVESRTLEATQKLSAPDADSMTTGSTMRSDEPSRDMPPAAPATMPADMPMPAN